MKEIRHLSTSVFTDKASYAANENVHIPGLVSDENGPVGGAKISLAIKKDQNAIYQANGVSTSTGSYSFDYRIPAGASVGSYSVEVVASKDDTASIDYQDSGVSFASYYVNTEPKIGDMVFGNYLTQYMSNSGGVVYFRGTEGTVTIWIEPNVRNTYVAQVTSQSGASVTFIGWETRPRMDGAKYKITIPADGKVGKFTINAQLKYGSSGSAVNVQTTKSATYYIVFNPPGDKAGYVYDPQSNHDEKLVYFEATESKVDGQWMGMDEGFFRDIQPYSNSNLQAATAAIQDETSIRNAILKLKDKARVSGSSSSLLNAISLATLSRSAGIPARIATFDANYGRTNKQDLFVTEVYVDRDWQVVDELNDVGPISRQMMDSFNTAYNEENNDNIFVASSNWVDREVVTQ